MSDKIETIICSECGSISQSQGYNTIRWRYDRVEEGHVYLCVVCGIYTIVLDGREADKKHVAFKGDCEEYPDSYKCPDCGYDCDESTIYNCEQLQCPKCGRIFDGDEEQMCPYIDLKDVYCFHCDKPARVKLVMMPNGNYGHFCIKHAIEYLEDELQQDEWVNDDSTFDGGYD